MPKAQPGTGRQSPSSAEAVRDVAYLTAVVPLMRKLGVLKLASAGGEVVLGAAPAPVVAPKPKSFDEAEKERKAAKVDRLRKALGSGIALDQTTLERIAEST